jgi:hypothetical protein
VRLLVGQQRPAGCLIAFEAIHRIFDRNAGRGQELWPPARPSDTCEDQCVAKRSVAQCVVGLPPLAARHIGLCFQRRERERFEFRVRKEPGDPVQRGRYAGPAVTPRGPRWNSSGLRNGRPRKGVTIENDSVPQPLGLASKQRGECIIHFKRLERDCRQNSCDAMCEAKIVLGRVVRAKRMDATPACVIGQQPSQERKSSVVLDRAIDATT